MSGKKYGVIYKATNRINGKIYIGQTTKTIKERMSYHLCARVGIFRKALKKYGLQTFDIVAVDIGISAQDLNEKEKYWIRHFNCKAPNGYNLTDGGEGSQGCVLTDEQKQRRRKLTRQVLARLWSDPTYRKNQSERLLGDKNPSKNPVVRQKISDKLKGRNPFWSVGKPNKGVIESNKRRTGEKRGPNPAISESNRKRTGETRKPLSEEHKKKISESNKRHASSR